MPNRILREGILTSPRIAKLGWPEPSSLNTASSILELRVSLPRCKAGDPMQGYKWALSMRLRAIRSKEAGGLSQSLIKELIASAGDCCPVCSEDMRYWVSRRWPTIDHVIALANGGTNERSNLRVVCNRCNSRKSDRA